MGVVYSKDTWRVRFIVLASSYKSSKNDLFHTMPGTVTFQSNLFATSSNGQAFLGMIQVVHDFGFKILNAGVFNERNPILQTRRQGEHAVRHDEGTRCEGLKKTIMIFPLVSLCNLFGRKEQGKIGNQTNASNGNTFTIAKRKRERQRRKEYSLPLLVYSAELLVLLWTFNEQNSFSSSFPLGRQARIARKIKALLKNVSLFAVSPYILSRSI